MRNTLCLFLFASFLTQCVTAQNEPRFYAEASLPSSTSQESALEVAVGQPLKISFILENGKNTGRFTPPYWEASGFFLLGSSQSSNISIINGQTTASASYNFTVTPMTEGSWTIPSVSIQIGDGELHTEPIIIQALPGADGVRPEYPKRSPSEPESAPKKKIKTIKM